MHKSLLTTCLLILSAFLLSACGFFDKDNTPEPTPLTTFSPQITPHALWTTRAGSGVGDDYLKMDPAINETTIFVTSVNGTVTAINKATGTKNWQINLRAPLTSGPAVSDHLLIVASRAGDVMALNATDGRLLWKTVILGEILAKPAIDQDTLIIKTVDGTVRRLSTQDGHEIWSFQQVEPNLILRGASKPLIADQNVIVGFANGNLVKLSAKDGQQRFAQTIAVAEGAFSIQRMIDIDADPILFNHHLYAATYQGKIAALDWTSGSIRWSRTLSSYTGMATDGRAVFISDATSHLWSLTTDSGLVNWEQTKLAARVITAPALMGDTLMVGDAQGYVHWLSKRDGHFLARASVSGAVYATPIVENNIAYVLTSKGYLTAYAVN